MAIGLRASLATFPLTLSAFLLFSGACFAQTADLPNAPMPQFLQAAASAGAPHIEPAPPVTLRKFPERFLTDEGRIFTSPARLKKHDLKWLLPLGAATGAALATDTYTMRHVVSRNPDFNNANADASDVLRDAAIGIPVVMYFAGNAAHVEHTREAGLLGGEAMLDAYVFDEVIKYGTLRERPSQDNARGQFFTGNASGDPSFISGHSIVVWSSAAVLAEEYHRPWQRIAIYTLASGVSLTRVLGQQHFPTDSLLGSAAGWLIGKSVYHAHHRPKMVVKASE